MPDGPLDLRRLLNCPFPFKQLEDTGEMLVHISTVERIMKAGWVTGATPEAKQLLKAYSSEIVLTFRSKSEIDDPDEAKVWEQYLNPKHYESLPFQIAGMQRIYTRFLEWQTGVILGDDVGLGKTIQAIGLIGRLRDEKHIRKVLVTTTTVMQAQWADEISKFSRPKLKTATANGTKPKRLAKLKENADIYIVNHEMFRFAHYAEAIDQIMPEIDLIVVDESSYIKNHETITHKAIDERVRRAKWALLLNATVIENSLQDFFAQLRFCDRLLLGNHAGFNKRYIKRNFYGQIYGYRRLREFRKRTAIAMYRRTRSQVALQLPEVCVQVRTVEMGKKQADLYKWLIGDTISEGGVGAVLLSRIAKIQQAAYKGPDGSSPKIEDLIHLLHTELNGERVVVFTRFREIAEDAFLKLSEFKPAIITGDTPHQQRTDTRRRFESKHGAGSVLIGTEAMDRGLNLQAAGVVVNLDLPWTPAKLRQRIGRINRVGQERKSILVINYIAKHPSGKPTIDDYMVNRIIPKRELFRQVLGDDDVDEVGNEKTDSQAVIKYISGVLDTKRKG